ncbi:MAG: hypothetical protein KQJ78_23615 [Deltaproteobacteria bacterium]|nr:hypothetical protein [Deltaproteobacteria bacterium]
MPLSGEKFRRLTRLWAREHQAQDAPPLPAAWERGVMARVRGLAPSPPEPGWLSFLTAPRPVWRVAWGASLVATGLLVYAVASGDWASLDPGRWLLADPSGLVTLALASL